MERVASPALPARRPRGALPACDPPRHRLPGGARPAPTRPAGPRIDPAIPTVASSRTCGSRDAPQGLEILEPLRTLLGRTHGLVRAAHRPVVAPAAAVDSGCGRKEALLQRPRDHTDRVAR